jgi:Domain of unknown function (DUF4149)
MSLASFRLMELHTKTCNFIVSTIDMSQPAAVPLHNVPVPMVPPVMTTPSAPGEAGVWSPQEVDRSVISKSLLEQGYTNGLIEALMVNRQAFAQSIWVVDNSGSMQTWDGHRIVHGESSESSALTFVKCSRWTEMQQTVDYHAQMAALLRSPTTFRLLNDPGRVCGPQIFDIAVADPVGKSSMDEELSIAESTMQNTQPVGGTPLTQHVHAIRQQIVSMQSYLQHNRAKVAVVLATDGLPTDAEKHEFVSALRSLEGLSVWIVVRLCTDEDDMIQYWNDLDSELELSLEVLDDFESEAKEVYAVNPWLTYGLPLHRMREMGFHHPLFDLLDERKLSLDEVKMFLRLLFGSYEAPDPEENWMGFCSAVERLLAKEKNLWNPVAKKVMPWIDLNELNRQYILNASVTGSTKSSDSAETPRITPHPPNTAVLWSLGLLGAISAVGWHSQSPLTMLLLEQAMASLHLFSFATWFGTMVYTTFILCIMMSRNLPRHTWGKLQAELFPMYYGLSSITIVLQVRSFQLYPSFGNDFDR